MKYYIADTHFGDTRIINLCGRPYKDLEEMTLSIIMNWNSTVDPKDEVYMLGDVAYRYKGNLRLLLDSLNGKKHLLIGNHDSGWMKKPTNLRAFRSIDKMSKIQDEGRSVVLCHYPLMAFDGSTRGGYHVFGHIHNNTNEPLYNAINSMKNAFNAGVDVNGFAPVTLDQLIESKQ